MTNDFTAARLIPCPACHARPGVRCRTWAGPTWVPCPDRLASVRRAAEPVIVGTWLDRLEAAVA